MNSEKRILALVLIVILLIITLTGCGSKKKEDILPTATFTPEPTETVTIAPSNDIGKDTLVTTVETGAIGSLDDEQKNSLNMLNYLAFITQEILAKKNNRIYIEKVYTSLINDINPSTVNDLTESHYVEMLDRLHEFEKILTKRERLQYLFEQNQAQAMRNAIPNPMSLLSLTNATNIFSLVASVAYMAVDAVSSYQSGMSSAEQTFLQGSWDLDDDESDTIHSLRKQTFMYMVEIVKGYSLPDKLALTEKKIDKLVEWNEKTAEEESAASKVHFYKTYESDYEGFGQYWLARAKAHFDNSEFEECLKSIERYEDLNIGIYRQDYELAKILPVAIGAASQIYDNNTYVEAANHYTNLILANTDIKNDWALRYFVATTYIDLCGKTGDNSYLRKAYKIVLENANELKAEQKKLNNEYLAEVKPEAIPQGSTDAKKKEIEAYNKQKQLDRKTELPPIYEPLRLNLDLLYALAERLQITDSEKMEMENILYTDGKSLFLNAPMNKHYRGLDYMPVIEYTGEDITIPAIALTNDTTISVVMHEETSDTIINDWTITKVDRKDKNDSGSYIATYHSKRVEDYDFKKASNLTIIISSLGSDDEAIYEYMYKVKNSKEWVFFDKAEFVAIK